MRLFAPEILLIAFGFLMIIAVLPNFFFRTWLWNLTTKGDRLRGLRPIRTPEWDRANIIYGIIIMIISVFTIILGVFLWIR